MHGSLARACVCAACAFVCVLPFHFRQAGSEASACACAAFARWCVPRSCMQRRHMEERHIKLQGGGEGEGEASDALQASRQGFSAAVRLVAARVRYPVIELLLGGEALPYNPIPLVWVGRSTASSNLLGLLTAVIWT